MKKLVATTFLIMLAGCGSNNPEADYQYFTILSPQQFKVDSQIADLKTSISNLGSNTSKQIDIKICSNVTPDTIIGVVDTLKYSGFTRIAFVTDGDRDTELQTLCAKYAGMVGSFALKGARRLPLREIAASELNQKML